MKQAHINKLNQRIVSIVLIFLVISLIIISNAFRSQLLEGKDNLVLANQNSSSAEIIRAPRGIIYDAEGVKLVNNDAAYNIYVVPGELSRVEDPGEILGRVAEMFSADKDELIEKYERSGFNQKGEPVGERVTVINNIDYDKFLANLEDIEGLPGIYVSSETKRNYVDAYYFAHIIGYMGDINGDEVDVTGLDQKAQIGKTGLEKVFDERLRGEDGIKVSERKVSANEVNSWIPKSYRYGDNIHLTIDRDWQESLYRYLESTANSSGSLGSAAVVMEADTGRVKAMVSYPTYDLNLFAEGISTNEFNMLLEDNRTPLLNRAVGMQIPTGSVFKIVMASALQQEGAITPDTIYKSGCFELAGGYKLCEADNKNYGSLNMTQALARSSNPYFCQASVELARKLGSDELAIRSLDNYFDQFGLGKKTGIDLPGEQPGTVPSPELKLRLQGEPWYLADLCNTAIGQGLVSATPIQMAQVVAAIVNGGDVYKPQLVSSFEDADLTRSIVEPEVINKLKVEDRHLESIREGMREAVQSPYGTAYKLSSLPGNPIGKTGSSEATERTNNGEIISGAHSWVVASFEFEGKDYVIVVAQQFGGRGYKSLPVAYNFIDCLNKDFEGCN